MEYIHVRSLEKYHPGYKDRTLQWAKIYFKMVQGDPDCELIGNEIDWGRLIKLILLELQAKTPLPNIDKYWIKKGFDIKKRQMSLTIQMLHNFLDIVTENGEVRNESVTQIKSKSNIKKNEEEEKEANRKQTPSKPQANFNAEIKELVGHYLTTKGFLKENVSAGEWPRFMSAGKKLLQTTQDIGLIKKGIDWLNKDAKEKGYSWTLETLGNKKWAEFMAESAKPEKIKVY